jgi:putative transposase
MPRRVYSEINLHITWHTKNNAYMITNQIESELYGFLKNKIVETQEVYFHAIGGISDHIHIAVSVPPTLKIDDWIGKLKGGSSYFVNHNVADHKVLEWQNGYGIVSFGTKDLKWVKAYILNQKEHHREKTTHERLEKIERDED